MFYHSKDIKFNDYPLFSLLPAGGFVFNIETQRYSIGTMPMAGEHRGDSTMSNVVM